MSDEQMLPTFVYGTLRPDEHNRGVWAFGATAVADGRCRAMGFKLVTNGGFPYAIPTDDPTDVIVGALVCPDVLSYPHVMAAIDTLEGYPDHYDRLRINVNVTVEGADVAVLPAWIYVPTEQTRRYVANLPEVPRGDWYLMFRSERLAIRERVKLAERLARLPQAYPHAVDGGG